MTTQITEQDKQAVQQLADSLLHFMFACQEKHGFNIADVMNNLDENLPAMMEGYKKLHEDKEAIKKAAQQVEKEWMDKIERGE